MARIGLDAAAQAGGFSSDWLQLMEETTDWAAPGPARFFLFTMKALAFIALRRHDTAAALAILVRMVEIAPADQVGYATVAALARGVDGE